MTMITATVETDIRMELRPDVNPAAHGCYFCSEPSRFEITVPEGGTTYPCSRDHALKAVQQFTTGHITDIKIRD